MAELSKLPQLPLGRYRHYKGGLYEVLGVARHSETLEPLVLYRSCDEPEVGFWARPFSMFIEKINEGTETRARFEYLGIASGAVTPNIG
jgi:hypothetical protein